MREETTVNNGLRLGGYVSSVAVIGIIGIIAQVIPAPGMINRP
jgi:hypothetical protein